MATAVTQSPSRTKPSLALKLGPTQANLQTTPSRSSSAAESFMTARTSSTAALAGSPTASSRTPSPRTPTSSSGISFLQEIDVWMDNIGRLVTALEDQHRQRRFNISSRSGNAGKENVGDTLRSGDFSPSTPTMHGNAGDSSGHQYNAQRGAKAQTTR